MEESARALGRLGGREAAYQAIGLRHCEASVAQRPMDVGGDRIGAGMKGWSIAS